MLEEQKSRIIEQLKDDSEYYKGIGKFYLSNSDIGTLLKDPSSYGKDKEKTVPMVQGSYFHTALLEPQKMVDFLICDVTSRNTNKYKEMCEAMGAEIILLSKEVEELKDQLQQAATAKEVCVCARARACLRACVRACVRICVSGTSV
jgi:hypothetical protein